MQKTKKQTAKDQSDMMKKDPWAKYVVERILKYHGVTWRYVCVCVYGVSLSSPSKTCLNFNPDKGTHYID